VRAVGDAAREAAAGGRSVKGPCGARAPAVMAGLLLLATGCGSEKSSAAQQKPALPAVPVTVAEVLAKTVPVQLRVIGNVEAYSVVSVKPQINGEIFRVHIHPGQDVQKGALLFSIDPRPFEASLRQAEANLARDRAGLSQTKAALSEKKAAQKQAEANVARDEAQLENARTQTHRYAELVKKEFVAKEQYDQIRPIYVNFAVPEQNLEAIKQYRAAGTLRVEAVVPKTSGARPQGALTFVNNTVDMTTGTIQLKGTFANGDNAFWPGQFVDVVL